MIIEGETTRRVEEELLPSLKAELRYLQTIKVAEIDGLGIKALAHISLDAPEGAAASIAEKLAAALGSGYEVAVERCVSWEEYQTYGGGEEEEEEPEEPNTLAVLAISPSGSTSVKIH